MSVIVKTKIVCFRDGDFYGAYCPAIDCRGVGNTPMESLYVLFYDYPLRLAEQSNEILKEFSKRNFTEEDAVKKTKEFYGSNDIEIVEIASHYSIAIPICSSP